MKMAPIYSSQAKVAKVDKYIRHTEAMMTYKGYSGSVRFGDEAEIFHGEVVGLRGVVTFQGRTVDEL